MEYKNFKTGLHVKIADNKIQT